MKAAPFARQFAAQEKNNTAGRRREQRRGDSLGKVHCVRASKDEEEAKVAGISELIVVVNYPRNSTNYSQIGRI